MHLTLQEEKYFSDQHPLQDDLEEQGDERQAEEEEEGAGNERRQKVDRDVAVREELLRRLQRLLLHYFILRKLKKRS